MEGSPSPSTVAGRAARGLGFLLLVALLGLHGWLTLRLFGEPLGAGLLSPEPATEGLHALRLQQGQLGAQALREQLSGLVYDPTFQAGYPQSPWFDGESPAAALFILLGGKHNAAESWKVGVALVWWSMPLAAALAALALRLGLGVASAAAGLALLLCWSDPGKERLFAGDFTTILASVLLLGWSAALVKLADEPHPWQWLVAVAALAGALWLQPLLLFLALPAGLAYYAGVGWRSSLPWQSWFVCGFFIALALNLLRFWDLARSCWLLTDRPPALGLPAPAIAWDWLSRVALIDLTQIGFVALLLALGAGGLALLRRQRPGGSFRGWAVLAALAAAAGLFGPLSSLLDRFEPLKFFFPCLLLACVPAAYALSRSGSLLRRLRSVNLIVATLVLAAPAGAAALLLVLASQNLQRRDAAAMTLRLGLTAAQRETAAQLQELTAPTARILWEDTDETEGWSPLLPQLTDRQFLGGLSRRASLECFWLRLGEGQLAGRPFSEWRNDEFQDLCRRFNIGWLVVRTPQAKAALAPLSGSRSATTLPDGSVLLTLQRPHSFILKGQGRLEIVGGRVSLTDLVPEDGEALVSLHYLHGLRATLNRVTLEPAPQRDDPLPLLRVKTASPLARLTLFGPE